jgi:hypothetical protein
MMNKDRRMVVCQGADQRKQESLNTSSLKPLLVGAACLAVATAQVFGQGIIWYAGL